MRAILLGTAAVALSATPVLAQTTPADSMRQELNAARAEIAAQREALRRQEDRLRALEARLAGSGGGAATAATAGNPAAAPAVAAAQGSASTAGGDPASIQSAPVETVGAAPEDYDRAPEVAVLGDQGSVVTRRGALTGELGFEYARADRNRAVFRGIELIESVLVGVFDINESRQDVLTANATLRYGITDRFEVGARVPYIYRSDTSVLAPISGTTPTPSDAPDTTNGNGIGDLELSGRYQLRSARGGWPFLIANMQAVFPTGTDPFEVPRDSLGRQLEAATGAGFYGLSPSLTAILPSDPVVLFGTLGYTFNLAKDVDTTIGDLMIERVNPGDAISASAGIGIAFNQRTTLNLGYAHTWAFGSETWTRLLNPGNAPDMGRNRATSRDLQVGRLLFGVTYRATDRASLNWSVELGATDDATDLRTVLRIPVVLLTGR